MADLKNTIRQIEPLDEAFARRARMDRLAMPHWALGRLMDLAVELAGMTRSMRPAVERRTVVTMAADHGVAAEGVSQYPPEVTRQMVRNFAHGGAGINAPIPGGPGAAGGGGHGGGGRFGRFKSGGAGGRPAGAPGHRQYGQRPGDEPRRGPALR